MGKGSGKGVGLFGNPKVTIEVLTERYGAEEVRSAAIDTLGHPAIACTKSELTKLAEKLEKI